MIEKERLDQIVNEAEEKLKKEAEEAEAAKMIFEKEEKEKFDAKEDFNRMKEQKKATLE